MTNYHEDAKQLRERAAALDDKNPLKLCLLTLTCVAECYSAMQVFENRLRSY